MPNLQADLAGVVRTVSSGELNPNQALNALAVASENAHAAVRTQYVRC
jgi:hypothetical protein